MQHEHEHKQQDVGHSPLRFGGKASHYHAAALSSAEADGNDEEAFGRGGGDACNRSVDSASCWSESELSSAAYPPLSPQAQSAIQASRRRFFITVALLVLGAVVLYVSGYRAGERHEHEQMVAALGASGTGIDADGSIVADESLLDADDDTIEELTVEETNDLDMDEIIEEAEEEAEEELALETTKQRPQEGNGNGNYNDNFNLPQNYQKFLIFAEQRSGSRFLTDLLDDHDQIICGNEELNHKDTSMNLKHMTIEEYMKLLEETYDDVFQSKVALSSANANDGSLVVGYKVMYNQGVTHFGKDLMARLDEAGIKVIHLIRRNKLLQYISFASNEKDKHLMADKEKAAELAAAAAAASAEGEGVPLKHQAHPKTKEDAQRIRDELTISGKHPDKILSFMEAREADDKAVSNLVSTYLDTANYAFVDYEDLSRETEKQMERLFALLGVEQRKVQSQMEKIHEGKLTRDYFKKGQQDAVKEALEKSEFRWMLDGW